MIDYKYKSYVESYINTIADDDKILEAIKVLALIELAEAIENNY